MLAFTNARIIAPDGELTGTLVTDGPQIHAIGPTDSLTLPADAEVIDARGLTLLPGFLDVHVHGGGGADTMDATADALRTIARTHAAHGTTGLLATTITQSCAALTAALTVARAAREAGASFCPDGAQILGVHLEGPYIAPGKAGAQPREFVRDYDAAEFTAWLDAAGAGTIRLITLAPERPGANALIDACRAAGIVVSLGHTEATAAQTTDALARGAGHATHLFNAMPPIHHREAGPIPLLLTDPNTRVEIIADGHHVAPEVLRLVANLTLPNRLILITDAIRGAGWGDGTYDLGGHPATVRDGRATLPDGTLAGSVLTMDRAAAHARAWNVVESWGDLARATSTNVAEEMDWASKGRLVAGADADLVLVDDALTVQATFVAGQCVYRREGSYGL